MDSPNVSIISDTASMCDDLEVSFESLKFKVESQR
jgi:hypothetical protein